MADPDDPITQLLAESRDGNSTALDQLIALIYNDLRRIAHNQLSLERPGHTLNTTALVHEAYMELARCTSWRDRSHFFAVASGIMRHVLVDYARRRRAERRGGAWIRIPLRPGMATVEPETTIDLLALEEGLSRLGERDERLAKVVECRFFGGMTAEATAEALGISLRTAERDWTRAKAYLYTLLAEEPEPAE